ncbi:MAG: class I SAM-dependent methyltransferase [Syntrophales bacterium]
MSRKKRPESIICEIFTHVSTHRLAAEIIRKHSSNQDDIREIALSSVNLDRCLKILDIGCGFGFFTEALEGKIRPEAYVTGLDIVEEYRPLFMNMLLNSGIQGRFISSGLSALNEFGKGTFDLILCSYALYFFPGAIPDIARVLNPDGFFIAITHDRRNMKELILAVKDVLKTIGMPVCGKLPVEAVISRFSSENGEELLSPWFNRIRRIEYVNTLIFPPGDVSPLIDYFRFKSPFFLSGTGADTEKISDLLRKQFEVSLDESQSITMSKDDTIFICSEPLLKQG